MHKNKTKVIFRWYRRYTRHIALFPQVIYFEKGAAEQCRFDCDSYMHVSQHGAANTQIVVSQTRLATRKEYRPLATELRQRGYRLDIRKQCTAYDRQIRLVQASKWT